MEKQISFVAHFTSTYALLNKGVHLLNTRCPTPSNSERTGIKIEREFLKTNRIRNEKDSETNTEEENLKCGLVK